MGPEGRLYIQAVQSSDRPRSTIKRTAEGGKWNGRHCIGCRKGGEANK